MPVGFSNGLDVRYTYVYEYNIPVMYSCLVPGLGSGSTITLTLTKGKIYVFSPNF